MEQRGHSPHRIAILLILLPTLALLPFAAAGCGEQMTRMEDNQVKLQAMVAANARQLATISSQIHANNSDLQNGIRRLDENDQSLAANVATVQDEQLQLHQAVNRGDQALNQRMASFEEQQRLLRDGVADVADVTQRTASNVTAIAREHATLHQMVQNSRQELAENIATVAGNQKTIQTGIAHLQQTDHQMTEQLVTLADGQQTLRNTIQDDNAQLTGQLASLSARHDELHTRVGALDELTNGVMNRTNDLAEGQAGLHAAMQSRTQSLAERIALVTRNQENLQALVDQVSNTATKTAGDVTALAVRQTDVQKTLGSNHKIVSGQMAAAIENQQSIQSSISGLHQKADQTTVSLGAVEQGQDALQATLATQNETVGAALTDLSQNQTNLQQQLGHLDEKSEALRTDVKNISTEQVALHETALSRTENLSAGIGTLAENQQAIRSGLNNLSDTTGRMTADIVTMAAGQDALQQSVQEQGQTVGDRMDALANGQQTLQVQVDTVTATTGQLTLDLMAMENEQSKQHGVVCSGLTALDKNTGEAAAGQAAMHESIRDAATQVAALNEAQQNVQDGIGALDAKTSRVATDMAAVAATQDNLQQAVRACDRTVRDEMKKLSDSQQEMRSDFDTVATAAERAALGAVAVSDAQARLEQTVQNGINSLGEKTNHLASNLNTLTAGQNSLQESLDHHDESVAEQISGVASGQQQIRQGLDTAVATAGQTALDVIAVASEQASLQRSLQDYSDAADARTTALAGTHEAMQANLDTVTATTGQLALDLIEVGDKQARLTQIVQANQTKLATELAQLAEDRQQFNERLGTAQTEIEAMAGSISMLDERLTKLHGTLQTNLDDLTALLDTRGRERTELSAQLKEELQAVMETVNQLRETQASLQNQMQQMHETTQGQADDILSAIGQLQRAPSDVRVSDAGAEVKASITETGE